MKEEQAKGFLKALGCKPEYNGGPWVRCSCPLAPWLHDSGKDSNPSFGLSISDDKASHYNCFSCQSGSAEELLQTLEMYASGSLLSHAKYNFPAARAYLEQEAQDVFPLGEFTEFDHDETKEFYEWPAYFIDSFHPAAYSKKAYDYLMGRGVTPQQVIDRNIRYDPKRNMVVFPFHSVYGKLAGARGRNIGQDGPPHHDYSWNKTNNTGLVWYNEEALNLEQPVIIVEGQFDYLTVARAYPPTMANLTAKPTPPKMKKLQQCPGVILLLDNDKTGVKAAEKYVTFCDQNNINVAVLTLPEGIKDPDQMGTEGISQLLKDFGLEI